MKVLIVDRIEENYAVCEDEENKFFAININELPENLSSGDVLNIDDNGKISINIQETETRKQLIKKKMQKLKNKSIL